MSDTLNLRSRETLLRLREPKEPTLAEGGEDTTKSDALLLLLLLLVLLLLLMLLLLLLFVSAVATGTGAELTGEPTPPLGGAGVTRGFGVFLGKKNGFLFVLFFF